MVDGVKQILIMAIAWDSFLYSIKTVRIIIIIWDLGLRFFSLQQKQYGSV